MSKYILREYYELCSDGICQDVLTEDEKRRAKNGVVFLSGKLQEADVKNGNGRKYPQVILEREVKKYLNLVKERRALGELDHPEDSIINLKNVSHLVTDVWWDGPCVMGKMDSLKCSFLRVDLQRKSEDLPTHLTAAAFIHHRAYIAQI